MGLFFVLMGLCLLGTVSCEKKISMNGMTVDVLRQSGTMKFYKDNEADGIVLSFDGIYEKTSDGVDITRHSFNNFALLNFTISGVALTTFAKFYISADIIVDSLPVTLTIHVYHVLNEMNVKVAGGAVKVYPGDNMLDVVIKNWPFCGRNSVSCLEGQTGAFLDFDLSVSGSKAPDSITGQIAGSRVIIPQAVRYSEEDIRNMPAGYPKIKVAGNKTTYTFRFEPFDSVLYEPVFSLTDIRSMTYAGVTAKLLGRSGKIELTSGAKKVVIELINLKEKDADGTDITDKNNRFAGQPFKLSGQIDETYPNTSIAVQKISGGSTMPNGAMVIMNLYVFKAGGTISNGDEYTTVRAGNVKFNLEISGWGFCTSACKPGDTEGTYLDIDIVIKGKNEKAIKGLSSESHGDTYDLGDSTVILSKKVYVDGAPQPVSMAAGYPMIITQGSKEVFRCRFPKFTNKVVYDPTIDLGANGVAGRGGDAGRTATLLIVVATILKILF